MKNLALLQRQRDAYNERLHAVIADLDALKRRWRQGPDAYTEAERKVLIDDTARVLHRMSDKMVEQFFDASTNGLGIALTAELWAAFHAKGESEGGHR